MAEINPKIKKISGKIDLTPDLKGKVSSGGVTDHNRLFNREAADQHPIEAITGLEKILDNKLDSNTAMPLINDALKNKACGLYFDAMKELAKKSYWYLTSEIDPVTKMGTKKSIISGPYDLGMGGGSGGAGGGGGVTSVTIKPYEWPSNAVLGATTKIQITWSSAKDGTIDSSITGTVYLTVNDKQVETRRNQKQGILEFDISEYIISGDNNIQVKVLDMYGTTGITIGVINGVSLDLESDFDSTKAFEKEVNFTYTPIGDVAKTVYFYIDGVEHGYQVVTTSNETQTYIIKGLAHGAHTLEVYFKAKVGGEVTESKHLFYDLICVTPGNVTPIIASDFKSFEQEQYISFNIPYRAYIYGRSQVEVSLSVNGEIIRTYEVNTTDNHIWSYKFDQPGNYTMAITCGNTSKTFEIHVSESKINVVPVEEGLALALSAHGRSNNENPEERATWSYTNSRNEKYDCTFNGFNWSSDGWILDKDGNNVLSVGGDARVEIPIKVFANDFKANGKTIELEIATRNIRDYDTTIISCLDNKTSPFYTVEEHFTEEEIRLKGFKVKYNYSILTNIGLPLGKHSFEYDGSGWLLEDKKVNLNDYGITLEEARVNAEGEDLGVVLKGDKISITYAEEARGFKITPQVATIRSQQSLLSTQYKEDEHIRIAFVVEQSAKDRIIWMYINGVASGALQYPTDDTFVQEDPGIITIGSSEAIVDIYNIRIYNNSLTNKQIVNNWLADMQDPITKLHHWQRNNVLDERGEVLMENLPADLPYIIWDIDPLPEFKGDKRMGNARYIDPSNPERNFTVDVGEYNVQGTSSSVYPVKNIRLRMRKKNGAGYAWYDDNGDTIEDWPITYPGGIGANYFTFKVDYASSEGANNVELTKLYNDASIKYGLLTPPQYQQYSQWNDTNDISVRVGIDGFPVVAFHKDKEGNVKFCTKANFNNDKANEDVYGFADGDESWETTNNSAAETKYQVPVTVDNFDRGFEIRFPDEDGYNDMSKLGPMTAWVYSTYRDLATNEALPEEVTFTYDEAVQSEGGSFSTNTVTKTFTHDTAEYRLAKFKAELHKWFNVDSCLFYYLYTELFLMIDSRAKNAFPTYFATRTNTLAKDSKGNIIDENTFDDGGNRWYWIPYDMDTAIGIDNKGKLSFDYYLEDIDKLDGADVFNGQGSVMWCNVRDAFRGELAAMYAELRNQKLISYDHVNSLFEQHQGKWPQVILNLDSQNKYILPLKNGDNYLEMLQGTKEQQRKWWLYNRFKYIDSKYNGGEAVKDFIQFRAYVDIGQEKPDLTIIPYANIYATASFGNGAKYTVSQRVKNRNEAITLKNPFGLMDDENDQETYIYSASQLKSIGDISGFHPDTVKIGNAIRLQELKVGDKSPDYQNPYLKELTVGANTLLRTIDARNCVNLGTGNTVAPDLSQCTNIEEIYFSGTKIKGIVLPDGGSIKKLHLPGTLVSLTIKNQPLLDELIIDNTNTTISKSVYNEGGHSFNGLVIKKAPWNDTSANADIYLADAADENAQQIRVSIIDKDLYDAIIENQSVLNIVCTYVDARFDLIDKTDIKLMEYSTRFIVSSIINDGAVSNVTSFIESIRPSVVPPTLRDFSTSLIETLWLEGIPSKSIKARELIENMKEGTEVRLIGIDETYNSWTDIEYFYNLLDRHYGINFNSSEIRPGAQVTGIIHIDTIPYKKYVELSARYPEVKIDAKQIICTVLFDNEGVLTTQNIIMNECAALPEPPEKAPTQAHYYTFDKWIYTDTSEEWLTTDKITKDLSIKATYIEHDQEYTVVFDTNSEVIKVLPERQTVKYNTKLSKPTVLDVPVGVDLIGWFTPDDVKWDFNNHTLLDHLTLAAKWKDENAPVVTLTVQDATHFKYEASDNLGIVAWAVTVNNTNMPLSWNTIRSTTELTGNYEITDPGLITFWIKDSNNNIAKASVTAYAINIISSTGIENYELWESATNSPISNVAISGTLMRIAVTLDSHYENLTLKLDNTFIGDNLDIKVNRDITIYLACEPKQYAVSFNLGGKGTAVADQKVTYLHNATKPLGQYWQPTHEVIDSWYLDPDYTVLWDFETSQVLEDTMLYAKWVRQHTPTELTLLIPEDAVPNEDGKYEVELTYSNRTYAAADLVRVDFGDGIEVTSADPDPIHLKYYYDSPGEKLIKIFGNNHGYRLGHSYDYQVVSPISYLVKANLAWDISNITDYMFRGASLTEASLTDYIISIGNGAFSNCKQLTSIEFPQSLLEINSSAFEGCDKLAGTLSLPKNLIKIADSAFSNCNSIENIDFGESTIDSIGSWAFSGCTGLIKVDIPETISSIGSSCFAGCKNLSKVILRNENLELGTFVFNDCINLFTAGPIGKTDSEGYPLNLEYAWKIAIPDYAFAAGSNQSKLAEVILPDTLITIGRNAFQNTKIETIDLPSSLNIIKEKAFVYCNLDSISIPASVKSIEQGAFSYCRALYNIKLYLTNSATKAISPEQGWFYLSNSEAIIEVPASIFKEEDGILPSEFFGPYWNIYRSNPDTFIRYVAREE